MLPNQPGQPNQTETSWFWWWIRRIVTCVAMLIFWTIFAVAMTPWNLLKLICLGAGYTLILGFIVTQMRSSYRYWREKR